MHLSELPLFAEIDFNQLALPSDGITVKQLRRRFPGRAENILADEGERLDAMWDAERLFVLLGYASVRGRGAVARVEACIPQDGGKAEAIRDLTADLIHYGLAEGPATAAQTIERLQEAGAALARHRRGRAGR